jgi:hypothetical protein
MGSKLDGSDVAGMRPAEDDGLNMALMISDRQP